MSDHLRQSMDRFGDDLCELVLNYLSIGDKLRFECISTQFKRSLFRRHPTIVLSEFRTCCHAYSDHYLIPITAHHKRDNGLRRLLLTDCLLRKFESLRELHLEFNCLPIDGQVLARIGADCPLLQSLHFRRCVFAAVDTESMARFGRTLGPRLKRLSFESCVWRSTDGCVLSYDHLDRLLAALLRETTRLQWFRYNADPYRFQWHNYLQLLATEGSLLVGDFYLKHLSEINISYGINYETIRRFSDAYCQQIRAITLTLNTSDFVCDKSDDTNELNDCLKQISRYELLSKLSLTIKHKNCEKQCFVDSGLELIADSCRRITKLEFNLFTESTRCLLERTKLFDIITRFPALTECKLKNLELNQLKFHQNIQSNDESVGCFAADGAVNSNLTHLALHISSLCDQHFRFIHHCLPRLRSLHVSSDRVLSDRCVRHVSKLSHLTHLKAMAFNCHLYAITDTGVQKLIKRCPMFRSLVLKCNTCITGKSVTRFARLAAKRPKCVFELTFVSQNNLYKNNTFDSELCPNGNLVVKDITKEFLDKYNYF